MKKEFNVKGFNVRSFMVNGLTAKWGIGTPRDESYKRPLYAWTIKGRVDGSTDFTPLPDIMGTANALTLTGFDGTAGSGFENGYLMFDGVDDKMRSPGFSLKKDWTLVGDWEFMSDTLATAGIAKAFSFFLFNIRAGNLAVHINTGGSPLVVSEVGVNAVCSDGRVYGKTWEKYINDKAQTATGSEDRITMGVNSAGTAFTTMKFKNLAIYDRVLSESQCKKAYDWLQTQ